MLNVFIILIPTVPEVEFLLFRHRNQTMHPLNNKTAITATTVPMGWDSAVN